MWEEEEEWEERMKGGDDGGWLDQTVLGSRPANKDTVLKIVNSLPQIRPDLINT